MVWKMKLLLLLFSFCYCSLAKYQCDERSVTLYYKKPIYEFSTGFLDRVSQQTDGHFVCSPIAAWLQLANLAEGAHGRTLQQILKVTGRRGKRCMRRILNDVNSAVKNNYKAQSLVIVDKFLRVNKAFKRKLEQSNTVKVAALNFDTFYDSAGKANRIIEKVTGISNTVEPYDFNMTSLLLADAAKFKSAWSQPFDPMYTTLDRFYYGLAEGEVKMMFQTGYFNYTKMKPVNAEILELPCVDEKYSMLLFLPTRGTMKDLYFYMKRIRVTTIFNLFKKSKPQLVNVKLPRFKINSELPNLAELIDDMGVSNIFNPRVANLKGISEYSIQVNGMKQAVDIEVTEQGVSAEVAQAIIRPRGPAIDFIANKPFAFMLVHKPTDIMLFAGVYSIPELF